MHTAKGWNVCVPLRRIVAYKVVDDAGLFVQPSTCGALLAPSIFIHKATECALQIADCALFSECRLSNFAGERAAS
jgi:hypothetical protein